MPPSFRYLSLSPSSATRPLLLGIVLLHRLSEDIEVRLMGTKTQHDEICVGAINTVGSVHIVVLLRALGSDKVQDLVFSFTRDERI